MTTIRKHWLPMLLVAIAVANLALGQYLWAGFLGAMAVLVVLRRHYLATPNRVEGPPPVRIAVMFLVGCIVMGVLLAVLAVENRNGAGPFAFGGAVLCAGLAITTVVAIVKLRRVEKHNASQADDGP